MNLLLHCSTANYIWYKLSDIFGEYWICPKDLHQLLLTKLRDFMIHEQAKTLAMFSFCYFLVSLAGKEC